MRRPNPSANAPKGDFFGQFGISASESAVEHGAKRETACDVAIVPGWSVQTS